MVAGDALLPRGVGSDVESRSRSTRPSIQRPACQWPILLRPPPRTPLLAVAGSGASLGQRSPQGSQPRCSLAWPSPGCFRARSVSAGSSPRRSRNSSAGSRLSVCSSAGRARSCSRVSGLCLPTAAKHRSRSPGSRETMGSWRCSSRSATSVGSQSTALLSISPSTRTMARIWRSFLLPSSPRAASQRRGHNEPPCGCGLT